MANVQITQLPQAGAITGSESVPIVQNGVTVQTTTGAIAASPSQTQTFVTVNQEPTLPNSRALSGGTGVGIVDGGAQSTIQITLNGASGSLEGASNGLIAKTGSNTVVARSIASTGDGISVTNGDGQSGNPQISLTGLPAALTSVGGTGILAVVGGSTIAGRQIYGTSGQVVIANGNGSGNPTISLDSTGVTPGTYNYSTITVDSTGRVTSASSGSVTSGTVTNVLGTSDQITVVNSTTTPTISIASNPIIPGSASITLPKGGTASRSSPASNGMIRYNTDLGVFEGYQNGSWQTIAAGTGVTSIATGTGLTGGPITSTGTISIDNTVVATLSGIQTLTNKTISGASNTLSNIGNSSLTNSSVTINGSSVSLGGSVTVTATASNALTIGTGLSGTSYNGSAAVTIAIDSTVATLTGSQTLTNKTLTSPVISTIVNTGTLTLPTSTDTLVGRATTDTLTNKSISGSSNTLTNIPNSALTNSSITLGTTTIALGATSLTPAGLTSVTVTQDPVSALQLATKQYVDGLAATGLYYHSPVQAATTQSLAAQTGGTVTYNNGSSGVGATITLSVALTTLDGYSLSNTNRILVKDETNQAYNGVYTWATGGTVLTRSTDTDSYGPGTGDLSENDYFFVQNGTVNKGNSYVCTTSGTITFGTTAITFSQFSTSQVYTGTSPVQVSGTVISLTTVPVTSGGTGLTSGTSGGIPYFSASTTIASSAALAANALVIGGGAGVAPSTTTTGTGVLTALGINTGTAGAFVVNGGALGTPSSGTLTSATGLPISTGVSGLGTGVATALAVNTGTAGAFVVNGGALGTPSSGTVTNLTGTASININGTVGATTANTGAFTTISASGVITSTVATGTAPFTVASTTQVANLNAATAGTATNATNTAITSNSTNATNYLTFVNATTGNLGQLVNSSITCNPSTGAITGGISGGTF